MGRVRGIDTVVAARILGPKPLWAILGARTVHDMRDASLEHEPGRQKGTRSYENACVEVGRGLTKVLRNGSQHT